MSRNRFTIEGLDAFKAQLRALPHELRAEGAGIVFEEGNGAVDDIKEHYARRSGELADDVSLQVTSSGAFGASVKVKSASPIAWMYENGTQLRHTVKTGASRGVMKPAPPARAFVPVMVRRRRRMRERLADLLQRHGLRVTGDV